MSDKPQKIPAASDIRELAGGLEELTAEDGPLYSLVCEVRRSNEVALRNVRLQLLSLVALTICIGLLALLTNTLGYCSDNLVAAEINLRVLTERVEITKNDISKMQGKLDTAPVVVSGKDGNLTMVLTTQEAPSAYTKQSAEERNVEIPLDINKLKVK